MLTHTFHNQVVWNNDPSYTSEQTTLNKVMEALFKEIA